MLTSETKRKLASATLFALPVALVLVTANTLSGPAAVQADAPVPAAATGLGRGLDEAAAPVDSTSEAAQRYIQTLEREGFGPTPFFYSSSGETVVEIETTPGIAPPPTFTVKAIMASARGNTALINGQAYRAGDLFGETGWRVRSINSTARSVTLEEIAGTRTATGSVQSPALDGRPE